MFLPTNFYSTRWPHEYQKGRYCNWRISASGTKKIIFMDLDLRYRSSSRICEKDKDDYIEIRGISHLSTKNESKDLPAGFCVFDSEVVMLD